MKVAKLLASWFLAVSFVGSVAVQAQPGVLVVRRPVRVVVPPRPVVVTRPALVPAPVLVVPAPRVAVIARPRRVILY